MPTAMTREEFQALLETFPADATIHVRRAVVERDEKSKGSETEHEFFGVLDVEVDYDEENNRIVIVGPAIKAGEETIKFMPTE